MSPLTHDLGPQNDRAPVLLPWRARATAPAPLNRIHSLSLSFSLSFLISSQTLSSSNLSYSHTTTPTLILCVKPRLPRIAKCREEGKLPLMRPLPQGSEPLGTRTEGDKMPSLMNGSISRYILTGGMGLGWRFMYDDLVRINLSIVREFCANFSSATQNHVYLRGKKIHFTDTHIRGYLGIPGDAPDADMDDAFIALAKSYGRGEDVNMDAIYAEIGRLETNWADNPAINIIPNKINNSVLNAQATA
ncbi:hypothetical protein PIB30_067824 [Stylosanthes scabra]|uniref:Uncharacterized protein n=1 Tax=Stylosanthes scabra TaxID=79078 RepID=A0ABU6TQ46_9FABA|nr:hypothetical protein [Stylosanthes scabra]